MVEETKFQKLQSKVDDQQREVWESIQNELKLKLVETDDFDWTIRAGQTNTIKLIAAVDISYSKQNDQNAVACLLVFSYPEFKLLYSDFE